MSIDNEFLTTKIEDGILITEFKKGLVINLDIAQKLVNDRLKMQNGKSMPLLIIANGFKIDSHEARDYMKKEGLQGMTAGCFVVNNYFEKIVVNFFLAVKPPPIPAKMFTNYNEAIEWCKKYRLE